LLASNHVVVKEVQEVSAVREAVFNLESGSASRSHEQALLSLSVARAVRDTLAAKYQLSHDRLDEVQLHLQVYTDAHEDSSNKLKRSEDQVAVLMHQMYAHGVYSTALTPLDDLDVGFSGLDRDRNLDDTDIDVDTDLDINEYDMDSSSGQLSSASSTPAADSSGISKPANFFDALGGSHSNAEAKFNGG
jgi:hypothetical protein